MISRDLFTITGSGDTAGPSLLCDALVGSIYRRWARPGSVGRVLACLGGILAIFTRYNGDYLSGYLHFPVFQVSFDFFVGSPSFF